MGGRVERAIASAGLLVAMVGACTDQHIARGVSGRNETATRLHFVTVVGGKTFALSNTLEPGQSKLLVSGSAFGGSSLVADDRCTKGDLVALADDGREVLRHPAPLCIGDLWTITTPGAS